MKSTRLGMGKGRGTGYKNMLKTDPVIHSQSAKGKKTYSNPTARKMEKIKIIKSQDAILLEKVEKMNKGLPKNHEIELMRGRFGVEDTIQYRTKPTFFKSGKRFAYYIADKTISCGDEDELKNCVKFAKILQKNKMKVTIVKDF